MLFSATVVALITLIRRAVWKGRNMSKYVKELVKSVSRKSEAIRTKALCLGTFLE